MSNLSPHLRALEDESIFIIREAVAAAKNPVLLYSIGKDSSVLLHLLMKAFHPVKPPVPLLHVDTGWKFREMIDFRDETARRLGLELVVHQNRQGLRDKVNPFDHGSDYTRIMKTEALKQVLDEKGYDFIFIGARRDEERSRAKERIFSLRDKEHRWQPEFQRPEFRRLFNPRLNAGESMRVSPLSNWTEYDVWHYIAQEDIPVVPLYFAAPRPVVEKEGALIMVDDARYRLHTGAVVEQRNIRFRTLGCYPLTAAMESTAETVEDILAELAQSHDSERQGRLIDREASASMEHKKRLGYF